MANKDQPRGFAPKGEPLRQNKYVAAGNIFPGDAVSLEAAGRVVAASASAALVGVAVGKAAVGEAISVWDHPQQLFSVQADEADVDAQTDINLNYDIVATAGSATYNMSRQELDSSTGAAGATLPLKLLAIEESPDNALGAQVKCIVQINNHQLAAGTGTAGV